MLDSTTLPRDLQVSLPQQVASLKKDLIDAYVALEDAKRRVNVSTSEEKNSLLYLLLQPGAEEKSKELLYENFLPSWSFIRNFQPIFLLKELDRAELLYSAITRRTWSGDSIHQRARINFLSSLTSAHNVLLQNFSYFSSDSTIKWALREFSTMKDDLAETDPVLEISLEKYFKILANGHTFLDYTNLEGYGILK